MSVMVSSLTCVCRFLFPSMLVIRCILSVILTRIPFSSVHSPVFSTIRKFWNGSLVLA